VRFFLNKRKIVRTFTLMPETVEKLEKYYETRPTTKSAFVDVAIQEKLKKEERAE